MKDLWVKVYEASRQAWDCGGALRWCRSAQGEILHPSNLITTITSDFIFVSRKHVRAMSSTIPVLLLKSHSDPPESDSYTRLFSFPSQTYTYNPIHIPVLTHQYITGPLLPLLSPLEFPIQFKFGGLIFTSQRAVSAFSLALSQALNSLQCTPECLARCKEWSVPIYAVGPATTKAVRDVCALYLPACVSRVMGQEAGTGEALARIILRDYDTHGKEQQECGGKKPLLFLTGEKHRDIVPRMLQSSELAEDERILVEEMVVYTSAAMEGFEDDFRIILKDTEEAETRWIVVFSAIGGEGMLGALGWLDKKTRRVKDHWEKVNEKGERRTFVASIGPTTRDYLRNELGFEVDVCAEKPSAKGVQDGIESFTREKSNLRI